ncbi:MAG TPA: pantoate--beta-alanine ligase [Leadbetterella sp.]|nr:pantoate--beta-alanine ligase [Leadbetterella sp.]
MKIFSSIIDTQKYLKSHGQLSVGFVPTMGALHDGHMALVRRSKGENALTVCSIFVNPTQFNNPDDLKKYPRTLEDDCRMLEKEGCDVVFAPSAEEMYPSLPNLKIDFGSLETIMEGKFRPGHFNGVGIVVAKLFNIIKPTQAYFGQKDIQQVAVIHRLINDLSFDVKLVVCETIRENDGLAMSSRNRRISPSDRDLAPLIYRSLILGKERLIQGDTALEVKNKISEFYKEYPAFELEYYEIADFETLESISQLNPKRKTAIILAAHLGGVRLIDNYVF